MLIYLLALSLALLFSISSNALAQVRVSELSAAELVQRLAHHTTRDHWTTKEIHKRLGSEALPQQRSELIDALLSVAKNGTTTEHRRRAMGYLTRYVKGPVVIDAYMDIATNDSDMNMRDLAAKKLPYLSRNDPRILSFLIEYLESLDPRATRAKNKIIVAIGVCGEIATDSLFDLWNSVRYEHNMHAHRASFYSAFGCTAATSPRSLDFLISELKKTNLKTLEGYATSILSALSETAQVATGALNDFLDPPLPPNYTAASQIRSAVERGLRTENHPWVIKAAATAYLHATRDCDVPSAISRLRGFLPYLEPEDQENLEFLFHWKFQEVRNNQNPPLRVNPPLMDRTPVPPTGSQ